MMVADDFDPGDSLCGKLRSTSSQPLRSGTFRSSSNIVGDRKRRARNLGLGPVAASDKGVLYMQCTSGDALDLVEAET